ncbi:MAG: hypothetical protein IJF59_03970, partial [Clostridia bacterium]|nr:hypothetical protein [Clostridia bacterium]
ISGQPCLKEITHFFKHIEPPSNSVCLTASGYIDEKNQKKCTTLFISYNTFMRLSRNDERP